VEAFDTERSMFTKSTDQKAEMPEHGRKAGGGTAENTDRVCLMNTARREHAER
jgi:hypothetical protein